MSENDDWIDERCYFCNEPIAEGRPCVHKEATPEVMEAANILSGVEFCDHFCCGLPENLCRAIRLAEAFNEWRLRERSAPQKEGK